MSSPRTGRCRARSAATSTARRTPPGRARWRVRTRGNALVLDADGDTIAYASQFTVWNAHAAVGFDGLPVPLRVAGEYFANARAAEGFDDDGFALGAQVGSLGAAGRWRAEYRYQSVGQEAIFSNLAQDDFLDAVNFRGHLAGVAFQYLSFARVRAWLLFSKRREPSEDDFQKRFRIDFDFSWRLP